MAGVTRFEQVAGLGLVTELDREENARKGVDVGRTDITALCAGDIEGIGLVCRGVCELGGAVGQVGRDAAALLADDLVVEIDSTHIVEIVGERVSDAPFGADGEVASDIDLDADAKGNGDVGQGVALGGQAVGVGNALPFRAEALQLIPCAGGVQLCLRVEREERDAREDIGREVVFLRHVIQFQEVEFGHRRKFRDGRHKAEIPRVVEGGVGGGDFPEQEVAPDGPSGRDVVPVGEAAGEV